MWLRSRFGQQLESLATLCRGHGRVFNIKEREFFMCVSEMCLTVLHLELGGQEMNVDNRPWSMTQSGVNVEGGGIMWKT
jgi:hypothetical protein